MYLESSISINKEQSMTFLALEKLIKMIEERKNAEVDHSYTASL